MLNFLNYKRLKRLNYQSILIVTYGRSGSTLLQGVLNSIDGCLIRGENNQFCYDLFCAYNQIIEVKKTFASEITSPFYGAHLLDEKVFINYTMEMVKKLLLADKDERKIVCYGFKEVRYINVLDKFPEYLNFLQKIFPNVAFVFNVRNIEDTLKSAWWAERNPEETRKAMMRCEELFKEYININSNGFLISYEDIINKSTNLNALFDFLGAEYSDNVIDKVLSTPHSYKPNK